MNKKEDIKKLKEFIIVMTDGARYKIERESKEKVFRWLNTGHASFLPVHSKEMVRLHPDNVKEIIEIIDDKDV